MYAAFFGLSKPPFSIAPDPHSVFLSPRHSDALAHLLYGVQDSTGGGVVLLSGDIGTGKTTLCRHFLQQVPAHCSVAYIFNPRLTVLELLQAVCDEFHLPPLPEGEAPTVKRLIDPLNAFLLREHATGRNALLFIDEAQNLPADVLEQLRLLTNLETAERKLLQIVLIGQPELRTLLARPELEQLAQRVIARYHLGPLDAAETRDYVAHRMQAAGHRGPAVFGSAALDAVARLSRGVPRRINLLCDRALLGAYAQGQRRVSAATVRQAAREVFDTDAATPVHPARRGAWAVAALAAAALGAGLGWGASWWLQARHTVASADTPVPATDTPRPKPLSATPATALAPAPATPPEPVASPAGAPTAILADTTTPAAPLAPWPPQVQRPPINALWPAENTAWPALAQVWGLDASGDPCASLLRQGVQCFRTDRMTLNGLQLLQRPALLRLQDGERRAWALLLNMDATHLTLQGRDGQPWRLPLGALPSLWSGDTLTLWRLPPGTTQRVGVASAGAARDWLDAQIARLPEGTVPAGSAAQRLMAFQRGHGVNPDGQPGPLTFMQMNRVAGIDEPRLGDASASPPLPAASPAGR
jgi:general secretion pathway protein A